MLARLLALLRSLASVFQAHRSFALENLALRQQLAALKHTNPKPKLSTWDRLFWGALRGFGSDWRSAFLIVQPATVFRWLPRRPSSPEARQSWQTFLENHRDCLTAMDFFMVPTATFRVL